MKYSTIITILSLTLLSGCATEELTETEQYLQTQEHNLECAQMLKDIANLKGSTLRQSELKRQYAEDCQMSTY